MAQTTSTNEPTTAQICSSFWHHLRSFPDGEKVQNCLQCGTCTGTCPVSHVMDVTPRELIALFRADRLDDVLCSRALWICASCYSCTVRCPADIRVTDTIYALKRLAMERNEEPPGFPVVGLARDFMSSVKRYGRNYEFGLGLRHTVRSRFAGLLGSAGLGLNLMRRGRLGVRPRSIRGIGEVRAIIDAAERTGGS